MILIYINDILFFIFIAFFTLLLSGVVTLIIYYTKYVNESSAEKRQIYNELNKQATNNSIVFLGDSLTDFYRTNEFFLNMDIYNRGIAGNTTNDVIKRLFENVISISPRKIFLQIGTNDLGIKKKPDYIVNNIREIIESIKSHLPSTEVYLISLYPINPIAMPLSKIITRPRKNQEINTINEMLVTLASQLNLTYIDVCSHLKDAKGNLKKEYTVEGLHISLIGYSKITEILKPFVI